MILDKNSVYYKSKNHVLLVGHIEVFMKTAIVGSRNLVVEQMEIYLPAATDEIVSGGAKGIDQSTIPII